MLLVSLSTSCSWFESILNIKFKSISREKHGMHDHISCLTRDHKKSLGAYKIQKNIKSMKSFRLSAENNGKINNSLVGLRGRHYQALSDVIKSF